MAIPADVIGHERAAIDFDRDRALVLRYQQGDGSAFDELYRRYYPRLRLYCQRRVGDRHAAEELAQEAFVRALRAMPRFAGDRRFYPWMTVIAQRLCIDHHRRSSRVEPAADIDPGLVEPDHDAIYAAVDQALLEQALSRVAPRHREVLDLREHQGRSYLEIAEHLDVPITTVEALLHRARKALRREFLAVSSGSRLSGFPVLGAAFTAAARLRARFASAGSSTTSVAQLAPAAFAGLAAIGLVLGPFGGSASPSRTTTAAPERIAASAPAGDATIAPAASVAVVAPTASRRTQVEATRPGTAPAPSAKLAVAKVYTGANATDFWGQQIDQAPVHVSLDPVVKVGLDPGAAINKVLNGGQ